MGSPTRVSGMKVKQGENVIWLVLEINLSTTISMKRSRQELSIDMFIQRGIVQNNQITLFSCFPLIPKTGISFYCADIFWKRGSNFVRRVPTWTLRHKKKGNSDQMEDLHWSGSNFSPPLFLNHLNRTPMWVNLFYRFSFYELIWRGKKSPSSDTISLKFCVLCCLNFPFPASDRYF